jgi:glycosyltransferase involved in cell wall biosynthesis
MLMALSNQLELSILIPAHNEEKRMEACLIRLTDFLKHTHPSSEIVISEDGSKDRTVEIVNEFKQNNSEIQISLLHAKERLGKGGGLKRGIEACNGRFTVFTDTDLPVPLETISQAVEILRGGADVVAGSRVMKGSKRDEPLKRRVLSRGFHYLALISLGMRWDSQCGFKAVRTSVGRDLFSHMANPGFAYDVDFLLQAKREGVNVVEMPVEWHYNTDSSVKLSKDILGMFKELVHIFFQAHFR